jgi:hypothetical protein
MWYMGPNYVGYYNLIEGNKYSILFYSTLCSISKGTLIKRNKIFFIYKEIQSGAVESHI